MQKAFILFIAGLVMTAFGVTGAAFADEYILIMSNNESLCQHMLSIYNNDLKKFGEVIHDQHEEFKKIKWEKKTFAVKYQGKKLKGTLLQSLIDLNNDGQQEVVLKSSGYVGTVETEDIREFKRTDFDSQEGDFTQEYFNSKYLLRIGGFDKNQYYLKELPVQKTYPQKPPIKESLSYCYLNGGYVDPFAFTDKIYVEMQSSYWSEFNAFYDWRIIIEVTKENQLRDICYCLRIKGEKGQGGGNITNEGE